MVDSEICFSDDSMLDCKNISKRQNHCTTIKLIVVLVAALTVYSLCVTVNPAKEHAAAFDAQNENLNRCSVLPANLTPDVVLFVSLRN